MTPKQITPELLHSLNLMIEADNADPFYDLAAWKHTSLYVKRLDNYECQRCKAKGRYSKGEVVHHVKHLKDRPDLALSVYDQDTGERQLETLCRACHRDEHPEHMRQYGKRKQQLTEERWD